MGCKRGSFHRWSTMITFLGDSLLHKLWRGRVVFSLFFWQVHSIPEYLKLEGISAGQMFQHPSPSKVTYLDHVLEGFGHLQRWRLQDFSGQPVAVLSHPHRTKSIPFAQMRISMLPAIGHHWKELFSILFAPSLLYRIIKSLWPYELLSCKS